MTPAEFESQIARLKQVFGEKAYPSEREEMLFLIIESCGDKEFESQVNQWISDRKPLDPPLGEQFREFRNKYFRSYEFDRRHNEENVQPGTELSYSKSPQELRTLIRKMTKQISGGRT